MARHPVVLRNCCSVPVIFFQELRQSPFKNRYYMDAFMSAVPGDAVQLLASCNWAPGV